MGAPLVSLAKSILSFNSNKRVHLLLQENYFRIVAVKGRLYIHHMKGRKCWAIRNSIILSLSDPVIMILFCQKTITLTDCNIHFSWHDSDTEFKIF